MLVKNWLKISLSLIPSQCFIFLSPELRALVTIHYNIYIIKSKIGKLTSTLNGTSGNFDDCTKEVLAEL